MSQYKFSKSVFAKESILKVVYLQQADFNILISEDEYNYITGIMQFVLSIDKKRLIV